MKILNQQKQEHEVVDVGSAVAAAIMSERFPVAELANADENILSLAARKIALEWNGIAEGKIVRIFLTLTI